MRSIRTSTLFVLCATGVVANFCGPAPAAEQPEAKAAEPILFPDGVLDAARRTAFVTTPKGGVQAVRLEDGKVLWTNDDAPAEPWLVAGDRVIARGERIYVLDAKEGKRLRQCDAPAYPKVTVPDRCTVSFNLWNPRADGAALEAKWYAVAHIDRSKGRPFAFEAWTAFNKSAPSGTLTVNLDTGKADLKTDPKPSDVTMGLVPAAARPDRTPAGLPEKLVPVWQQYYRDQYGRITVLDGRVVGVEMKLEKLGAEYAKHVVLNTWDLKTGAAGESVELTQGKALDIANIALTADRRHAAVQFSTSALTIYSLATRKPVAKDVKGVSSPESAFVDEKRLYHVVRAGNGEQALKAIDLESGKVVWDRALKPRPNVPLPP